MPPLSAASSSLSLAGLLVVVDEPLHRLLDGLGHGGELEVREVLSHLLVRGGLLVLAVSLGGVPNNLALELLCVCVCVCVRERERERERE